MQRARPSKVNDPHWRFFKNDVKRSAKQFGSANVVMKSAERAIGNNIHALAR